MLQLATVLTTPYRSLALKKIHVSIYHHTSAIVLNCGDLSLCAPVSTGQATRRGRLCAS